MTRGAARVVVASTRAASGDYEDRTGPVIVDWLRSRGFEADLAVVADGAPVGGALAEALSVGPRLVVTTGGTGLSPDDATPEETAPLLDRELPGFAEELRRRGAAASPHALLSRGLAGVAGRSLVVNLPGSRGGVRDGLDLLGEILDHALEQIEGGHGHDGRHTGAHR